MNDLNQLGMMLWPLLACSVAGLALIIERCIYLIRHRCRRDEFEIMIDSNLTSFLKDLPRADFPFKNSPLRPLTDAFFRNALRDRTVRKDAAEAVARAWLTRCRSPIKLMGTLAQVAPLLGLTGTVLGLVETFRVIQSSSNAINPSLMAGGIWEALLTTIAGMLIAIPLLLCVRFFNSRIETISNEVRIFFTWLEAQHLTPDSFIVHGLPETPEQ